MKWSHNFALEKNYVISEPRQENRFEYQGKTIQAACLIIRYRKSA